MVDNIEQFIQESEQKLKSLQKDTISIKQYRDDLASMKSSVYFHNTVSDKVNEYVPFANREKYSLRKRGRSSFMRNYVPRHLRT